MKQFGALCLFFSPSAANGLWASHAAAFQPSTPGMNVTNMPLAPSGGQAPVSQVCPRDGFFLLVFVILETSLDLATNNGSK